MGVQGHALDMACVANTGRVNLTRLLNILKKLCIRQRLYCTTSAAVDRQEQGGGGVLMLALAGWEGWMRASCRWPEEVSA